MKTNPKVLVAVDFSEGSSGALEVATAVTSQPIDLVHVWDLPAFLAPDALVALPPDPRPVAEVATQQAELRMKAFAEEVTRRGIEIGATRVLQGNTADSICKLAENGGYDLVAVGTHGRSGLNRLLLGSVAERVVRHCKVPVLSVRG
jgi:nucleotide-binding universal stress UspA family protein